MCSAAATCLQGVAVLKLFKYVTFFRGMTVIWRTVAKAKWDLAQFIATWGIIVLSFAMVTTMTWGYYSKDFATVLNSCIELIRFAFGEASRRRDCHSATPPSTVSRCFNRDGERASAK